MLVLAVHEVVCVCVNLCSCFVVSVVVLWASEACCHWIWCIWNEHTLDHVDYPRKVQIFVRRARDCLVYLFLVVLIRHTIVYFGPLGFCMLKSLSLSILNWLCTIIFYSFVSFFLSPFFAPLLLSSVLFSWLTRLFCLKSQVWHDEANEGYDGGCTQSTWLREVDMIGFGTVLWFSMSHLLTFCSRWLPCLFLQVIQSLNLYPRMITFTMGILERLVKKQVWLWHSLHFMYMYTATSGWSAQAFALPTSPLVADLFLHSLTLRDW